MLIVNLYLLVELDYDQLLIFIFLQGLDWTYYKKTPQSEMNQGVF